MNKAYSNKALPAGTVLREWRLEEVLGVGGFGIVYKGRGIYFNEQVAIKEYFPSSISERDSADTVVPIDSDSEEVHALGLKKFVEEAVPVVAAPSARGRLPARAAPAPATAAVLTKFLRVPFMEAPRPGARWRASASRGDAPRRRRRPSTRRRSEA